MQVLLTYSFLFSDCDHKKYQKARRKIVEQKNKSKSIKCRYGTEDDFVDTFHSFWNITLITFLAVNQWDKLLAFIFPMVVKGERKDRRNYPFKK